MVTTCAPEQKRKTYIIIVLNELYLLECSGKGMATTPGGREVPRRLVETNFQLPCYVHLRPGLNRKYKYKLQSDWSELTCLRRF